MEEYQAPLGDVFDVPPPSVGQRLARARVEKGLELTDLARDTRIPQRHLAAIEADSHDSLPALTYTLGFVRTFARMVDLPEDEVAAQFKAETTKSAHVPQTIPLEPVDEARLPSRGIVAASGIAVVAIVAGMWAWGAGVFQGDPPPPPVDPAPQVEAAATMPEPMTQASAEPLVSGDAPVPGAGDATQPSAAAPAVVPVSADPAAAVAQPVAGGPVVLTASEDVWIKVYDKTERKTVKMGVLAPGESYAVPTDRDDLLLWTGRAGALKVTVGGKPVPSLGGPRDTVQDVSLAPSALLARAG